MKTLNSLPYKGQGDITCLAYAPGDGHDGWLASGCSNGNVVLWDLREHQPHVLFTKPGHPKDAHTHGDWVTSVAFSPDGKTLASGSFDKSIILWDVGRLTAGGAEPDVRCLKAIKDAHGDWVMSVAFSPDGKTLASGGVDKKIHLWNAADGKSAGSFRGEDHTDTVFAIAFSPDGKTLASGAWDQKVKLWDVGSRAEIPTRTGEAMKHARKVYSVEFSPDGRFLVSGGLDGIIRVWDAVKPSSESVTQWPHAPEQDTPGAGAGGPKAGPAAEPDKMFYAVRSLDFSPDGTTLASASWDKSIRLWDVRGGFAEGRTPPPKVPPLLGHEDFITSVAFSLDGKTLASGGSDKAILFWDSKGGGRVGRPLNQVAVRSLAFNTRRGTTLAASSFDDGVALWDVSRGLDKQVPLGEPLRGHKGSVGTVAFNAKGDRLVSAGWDGKAVLWNLDTRRPEREFPHWARARSRPQGGGEPMLHRVLDATFRPRDPSVLLTSGDDGRVVIWDAHTGRELSELPLGGGDHKTFALDLAFNDDGTKLAVSHNDHTVSLWSFPELRPLGHSDGSGGGGGTPVVPLAHEKSPLWDVAASHWLSNFFDGGDDWFSSLAFNAASTRLAAGCGDGAVYLWNVTDGTLGDSPLKLQGHTDQLRSVAFSPDGMLLASASASPDGVVLLWDPETGQLMTPLPGAGVRVNQLTFHEDARSLILAAGCEDGSIVAWDLSLETWKKRAEQITKHRQLTRSERSQYLPRLP